MSDLIDYLRARLDEEEAIAREATQGGWSWGLDPRPKTGSALHADRGVTVLLTTVHDLDTAGIEAEERWCELIATRLSQACLDLEVPA